MTSRCVVDWCVTTHEMSRRVAEWCVCVADCHPRRVTCRFTACCVRRPIRPHPMLTYYSLMPSGDAITSNCSLFLDVAWCKSGNTAWICPMSVQTFTNLCRRHTARVTIWLNGPFSVGLTVSSNQTGGGSRSASAACHQFVNKFGGSLTGFKTDLLC